MTDDEIKKMLDKQLELLAEQSETQKELLPSLSHAICEVLAIRAGFDAPQGI